MDFCGVIFQRACSVMSQFLPSRIQQKYHCQSHRIGSNTFERIVVRLPQNSISRRPGPVTQQQVCEEAMVTDGRTSLQMTLGGPEFCCCSCSFAPDGRQLAVTPGGILQLWDLERNARVSEMQWDDASSLSRCDWSPTGSLIAVTGHRRGALWNPISQTFVATFLVPDLTPCQFSPDGELLALSTSREVQVYHVATQQVIARVQRKRPPGITWRCGWSSQEPHHVATGAAEGAVELWDIRAAQRAAILVGHRKVVEECSYAPDGWTLATASWDGTVRVWDTRMRRSASVLYSQTDGEGFVCSSFSPRQWRCASGIVFGSHRNDVGNPQRTPTHGVHEPG